MTITRAYTFNTGSTISGTVQRGALAAQIGTVDFKNGNTWVSGPDESLGYVICSVYPINRIKGIVIDNLVLQIEPSNYNSYIGSGSNVKDLSGNNINGILGGNVTYNSSNGGNFSISDPGHIDFGNISSSSPISFTSNFSIEIIFKPTVYQTTAYYGLTNILFRKGNLSTVNYLFQLNNDTTVNFIKRGVGESLVSHTFNVSSMLNNINILTFVIDSNTTVNCYMNGEYINSKSVSGTPIEVQSSEPTSISYNNTDMSFLGNYYSCKIYSKNLSESEVKQNYNAQKERFGL